MAPATLPQHRWICNRQAEETGRHCCLRELQTPEGQGTARPIFLQNKVDACLVSPS
jgi:hypothetical protein